MLYFFYGSDDYQIRQRLNQLHDELAKSAPLARFVVDTTSYDKHQFQSLLSSNSLFNEPKQIIIGAPFTDKDVASDLVDYIDKFYLSDSPDIHLVIHQTGETTALEKKHPELFKALTKHALAKEFQPLKGQPLNRWLVEEFKKRNCTIASSVCDLLIGLVGGDTWALAQEVDKLASFKNTGVITESDIRALTTSRIALNIFDLTDALAQQNRSRAFALLFSELASGRDPYYILTMLIYQFRSLLNLKDLTDRKFTPEQIAKKAKLHPFVIRKTLPGLTRFSLDDLKRRYANLGQIEIETKRGNTQLIDALYQFVILV